MLTTFVRPTRASLETQPCDNDKITTKDKACVEISGRTLNGNSGNEDLRFRAVITGGAWGAIAPPIFLIDRKEVGNMSF